MLKNRLFQKLNNYYPFLILFLLEFSIFILNFKQGTYFLGWDNLFPEMNFYENFKRSIFGVWLEHRGLGLLDGMSFASNIPHYLFLFLLSGFLPQNLLRYVFIFSMHLLGGIGMYLLTKDIFSGQKYNKAISLFSSFFYLLNIGTIQIFYAPYEVFTVHFAALPLLLYLTIKWLNMNNRKTLFLFVLFSFLLTPQAHVPTLFLIFLISQFSVIFFYLLKAKKSGIKAAFIIIFLTFLINSYWGLPYFYSALNNAKTISNSKINQMATEDIFLKNKAYGNLSNVSLIKGFSLDFVDAQTPIADGYMMDTWREHTKNVLFTIIGFLFFSMTFLGIVDSVRKRKKQFYPFITLFIISFLMLGTNIPILGGIYGFLSDHIPYFFQIFRFTFTKFSILYVFSFSLLLSAGLLILINFFTKRFFRHILIIIPFLLLFYYSLPVFNGQFLYRNLKLNVPEDYFALVNYFNKLDKNQRIALLPQTSFYGWTYTSWGYRGSGFIWYGLPQASMDGAFYPWSKNNENYFWEISQAIYSTNQDLLENVLEKYQINYIIVDSTVLNPLSGRASYIDKTEEMFKKSKKLNFVQSFDKIKVYNVNLNTKPDKFVFLINNLAEIMPVYNFNNLDQSYLDQGNYLSRDSSSNPDIYYPFRSIFTRQDQKDLEFKIEDKGEYFSFRTKIPSSLAGSKLIIPPIESQDISKVDDNSMETKIQASPKMFLDNELINIIPDSLAPSEILLPYIKNGNLEIRIPKIKGYQSFENSRDLLNAKPLNCDRFSKGINKSEKIYYENTELLRLTSINSSNCIGFPMPNLYQRKSFLVSIESRNIDGKSLLFAVINRNSERADLETYLPKKTSLNTSFFIIPPMEFYGQGYGLHFDSRSIGQASSINDLGRVSVNPIPYNFLTSLKIIRNDSFYQKLNQNTTLPAVVDHPNPSLYRLVLDSQTLKSNQTLVLSQSFDKGWKAYTVEGKSQNYRLASKRAKVENFLDTYFPFIFGEELKEHVLVNNWANGWIIQDQKKEIVIIFWPQYLEYGGFVLLIVAFCWIILFGVKSFCRTVYLHHNSNNRPYLQSED